MQALIRAVLKNCSLTTKMNHRREKSQVYIDGLTLGISLLSRYYHAYTFTDLIQVVCQLTATQLRGSRAKGENEVFRSNVNSSFSPLTGPGQAIRGPGGQVHGHKRIRYT